MENRNLSSVDKVRMEVSWSRVSLSPSSVCVYCVWFPLESDWLSVLCPQIWMPITAEDCWIWWREGPGSSSATSRTTWRTRWKTHPPRSCTRFPRKSPTKMRFKRTSATFVDFLFYFTVVSLCLVLVTDTPSFSAVFPLFWLLLCFFPHTHWSPTPVPHLSH